MTVSTSTDTKDMEERIIQRLRTEQASPPNDTDENTTAMICRILNVPPEVWESMTQEARDWILRERRHLRPMMEKTTPKKTFPKKQSPPQEAASIPNQYSKANLATTDSNDITDDDMAMVEAYFQSVLGDSSDDEDDHQTAYSNTIQTIRVEEEIGELHQSNLSSQDKPIVIICFIYQRSIIWLSWMGELIPV